MKSKSFIISVVLAILLPALLGIVMIKLKLVSTQKKINTHNSYKTTEPTIEKETTSTPKSIFREVITFEGNSSKDTTFHISSSDWLITWSTKGKRGDGTLLMNVWDDSSEYPIDGTLGSGESSGQIYMLGEGNYYLGIIADQLPYTILIEEIHYEEKVFTQKNEILDVFPEFDFKIVSNDETTKYLGLDRNHRLCILELHFLNEVITKLKLNYSSSDEIINRQLIYRCLKRLVKQNTTYKDYSDWYFSWYKGINKDLSEGKEQTYEFDNASLSTNILSEDSYLLEFRFK